MQYIRSPVSTVCIGQAASMGSLLLTAGAKGKRYALPNARIMVHQPSGGAQGQATDIEIQAREILTLRKRLNEIYVRHTGQPIEAIERKLERDTYMSAEESRDFGLVDAVVESRAVLEEIGRPILTLCLSRPGRLIGVDRPDRDWSSWRRRGGDTIGGDRSWFLSLRPTGVMSPLGSPRVRGRSAHEQVRRFEEHSLLLILRQVPARGAQAHRRPDGVHLRRMRRALHGHHPRGA